MLFGTLLFFAQIPSSLASVETSPQTPTGIFTWHLNNDVLLPMGVRLDVSGRDSPSNGSYRSSTCGFHSPEKNVFALGCVVHVEVNSNVIDLRNLIFVRINGDSSRAELRDPSGAVWFTLDHAHASLDGSSINHADLRIGPALTTRLGRPSANDVTIGGADVFINSQSDAKSTATCNAPWAGPQVPARIRLILMSPNYDTHKPDSLTFERCREKVPGQPLRPCVNTSKDGEIVFAPDASLENIGGSAIPWYGMLSGRFPPYDNDQHPFLIWNLYRIEADGMLRQIGKSGVKHAFYAINANCGCPAGHVVFPGCQDTYSSFNNDSLEFIGPRDEVIPAKGLWLSCYSVFDSNCDGLPGPRPPGQDDGHLWRMNVLENELEPSLHPGSRYFFEYGYVIRDQDDPALSFGYREVHPQKISGENGFASWQLNPGSLEQGFVASHWLNLASPAELSQRTHFATESGSGDVLVRVIPPPPGRTAYHYIYVLHNIDLAAAKMPVEMSHEGIGKTHGIRRAILHVDKKYKVENLHAFDDRGEIHPRIGNNSDFIVDNYQEVTWGSILTVAFDSLARPVVGQLTLEVRQGDRDVSIEAKTLTPAK